MTIDGQQYRANQKISIKILISYIPICTSFQIIGYNYAKLGEGSGVIKTFSAIHIIWKFFYCGNNNKTQLVQVAKANIGGTEEQLRVRV